MALPLMGKIQILPTPESIHFGKRSLKPFNFYFRLNNSASYERRHLQLKFDTILRSLMFKLGGRGSGQGRGEKKFTFYR